MKKTLYPFLLMLLVACSNRGSKETAVPEQPSTTMDYRIGTFGYDLNFLRQHHEDAILLHDETNTAQIIVLPAYQARVMTSTARGNGGDSFGWLNYDLIASQKPSEHMHAFGGEERFWLGPEGGQFSIYFKKGVAFTFDNWLVPKEIDTEPFTLVGSSQEEAKFEKEMHFENYSGTQFDLLVNRNIRLLGRSKIESLLNITVPADVETVAFESENILTNKGKQAWNKETGMLSIWILSMMNASDQTTVAIPFKQGDQSVLGKVVTDDYFGKVPSDRLAVRNGVILFKADGKHRSKIGISPLRALRLVTSYDAVNTVLTIAEFTLPEGETDYVNSLWELQQDPFNGDAINAYNDGPVNGIQMGDLYEIESSSPAAALSSEESLTHYHRTIHLKGSKEGLDKIALKLLGIHLDEISL
ncbi:MAG: hypothetical protein OEV74_17940 [Cyclobacteriaceae bacterium]|nr:hypothetical protein [Cyclobacteriaceae bacterium]MDH4298164.1 hypothetical protein [Cyclobacteriaceae bacterium]MDH5248054.1 hypothetical protein [Cyclobacteriaceae bacterium]